MKKNSVRATRPIYGKRSMEVVYNHMERQLS
jgi:hypothetical protein